MIFRCEFNTDNAAFVEAPRSAIADILRMIAARINRGDPRDKGSVINLNGNEIGQWEIAD